jgi:kynurenine formamidase
MTHRLLIALSAAAALGACARPAEPPLSSTRAFPAGAIVDLSHAYGADTVFWPTAERFKLEVVAAGMTPAGFYYEANNFTTAEHGGTHMDAPVHFAEGRHAADEVPLERLVGQAVVVDVSQAAAADNDYRVSVADLTAFEAAHGRIPDDAILLIRTGFASRWPDAARYLGTAERGPEAVAKLHFPGVHPDAAQWLRDERRIAAIGIDTASIDYGQSTAYETHRILYEANIPGFENLASLDRQPPTGAVVSALPMKFAGGSGAPLRAIDVLPSQQ